MTNIETNTNNTIFANTTIATMSQDDVINHVAGVQKTNATTVENYRKRSRESFSKFMLEARTTIKTLQTNVSADTLATLFTRHQIKAATGDTSEYTPFIKLIFGKRDEKGEKKKFAGEEHVQWNADDSFARYFNFFEVIDRDYEGEESGLLKWVLGKGGPAAIVEAELTRKREGAKPNDETVEAQGALYLAETRKPPITVEVDLPEKKGRFMSVIVENTEHGLRWVALAKADAQADFNRIAAAQFAQLTKAKEEREAEEARTQKATETVRAEIMSDPAKAFGGLSRAETRALLRKVAKEKGIAVDPSDEQAAG